MDVRSISSQSLLDALTSGQSIGDKDDAFARMLDRLTRRREEPVKAATPGREPVRPTARDRAQALADADAQARADERRASRERDRANAAARETPTTARPQPRVAMPSPDLQPPAASVTPPAAKPETATADRRGAVMAADADAAAKPGPTTVDGTPVADDTAGCDDAADGAVAPVEPAELDGMPAAQVTIEATVTVTETVITLVGPGQSVALTSAQTDLEVDVTVEDAARPIDGTALPPPGSPGEAPLPEEVAQDADAGTPALPPAAPEPAAAPAGGSGGVAKTAAADSALTTPPVAEMPVAAGEPPQDAVASDAKAATPPADGDTPEKLAAATAKPAHEAASPAGSAAAKTDDASAPPRNAADLPRFQEVATTETSDNRGQGNGEERPKDGAAKPSATPVQTDGAQTAQPPPPAPRAADAPAARPAIEPSAPAAIPPTPPADAAAPADHAATPISILEAARGPAAADPASPVMTLRAGRAAHAPMGVPDQVAVHIQKNVKEGNDQFTIQLRPDELGRIDIRLEFGRDGKVSASVQVERPQTLEMLQRDARGLERALQDAGLNADSNSLSFSLRGEGNPFESHGQGARNAGRGRRGGAAAVPDEAADLAAYTMTLAPGRVDVRV